MVLHLVLWERKKMATIKFYQPELLSWKNKPPFIIKYVKVLHYFFHQNSEFLFQLQENIASEKKKNSCLSIKSVWIYQGSESYVSQFSPWWGYILHGYHVPVNKESWQQVHRVPGEEKRISIRDRNRKGYEQHTLQFCRP